VGGAHFGASVAVSATADVALVGGFKDNSNRGAAWSFTRSGSTWTATEKLTGLGEKHGGWFGFSVALSGSGGTALIGGPENEGERGGAWVFSRAGAGWGSLPQRLGSPEEAPDKPRFGFSVALSGSGALALIGGPRDTDVAGAVWPFADNEQSTTPGEEEQREREREEEVAVTPAVESVQPGQGPPAGGTAVTIRGAFLSNAVAVYFGAPGRRTEAGFRVISSKSIIAVSPAHAEETVHVTVKLRGGAMSAASARDLFSYITPPPPPAGGAATPAATPAGTTLGSGPLVVASTCSVSLLSRSVSVSRKARARFKLRFTGSGACRGRLTLSVRIARAHRRALLRTIASGAFSLLAGRTAAMALTLNRLGRKLLHDGHGRLGARLAIVRTLPGPAQARTASVRLTLQRGGKPAMKH
jgi:hypothetical protein